MSDFQVTVKEVDNVVVLATDGYLNNIGGEKISEICDEYLDKGKNMFLNCRALYEDWSDSNGSKIVKIGGIQKCFGLLFVFCKFVKLIS